jgi:hypothetical protein
LVAIAALAFGASVEAQTTLYWDRNGSTAGFGTPPGDTLSGTWQTNGNGNKNWSSSSLGNVSTVLWTPNDTAIFAAGDASTSYTVTVGGGTQNVAGISIQQANPTFTTGTINFTGSAPSLTVASSSTLTFSSTITSTTGNLSFGGGGTLALTSSLNLSGTLTVTGGTLQLSTINATIGTLNITGNTIIDFSGASTLNLTNLTIASGATLTVTNWQQSSDFFYAQNWTGATSDTSGTTPMTQITFTGFSSGQTYWDSGDKQIRPNVPEPSTYGAFFLGAMFLVFGWRRVRRAA